MRKLFVVAGRVLLWLSGAALTIFGAWYAINSFDDPALSPAALQLAQFKPTPVPDQDNLYLALLGLNAPSSHSPVTAGLARVAKYEAFSHHVPSAQELERFFHHDWEPAGALAFKGSVKDCYGPNAGAWSVVETSGQRIKALIADNAELYERYLALHKLSRYNETAAPGPLAPIPVGSTEVRHLFLANLALRVKQGSPQDRTAALQQLREDLRTWKLQLEGAANVLTKMLASAYVQGDLLLLSDILSDRQVDLSDSTAQIEELLAVVPIEDWRLGEALTGEYRWHAAYYRSPPTYESDGNAAVRWVNRFQPHFLKVNATLNLDAAVYEHIAMVANAPAEHALAQLAAYEHWLSDHLDLASPRTYIHNPIGRTLIAVGSGLYGDYVLRLLDGAALQRLVRLGFEIRRQQVEPAAIPAFLAKHPEWSTHPGDHRPFLWHPDTKRISIQTLGSQQANRRYFINV